MNGTVSLQCAQCGDRRTVAVDGLHRVRHGCWFDEAAGQWLSTGWAVDE